MNCFSYPLLAQGWLPKLKKKKKKISFWQGPWIYVVMGSESGYSGGKIVYPNTDGINGHFLINPKS